MPKNDITIGISEDEVENLLIEAGILGEKQIDVVNKIIKRNNELMLKYIDDNILKIYSDAMKRKGWKPPMH